MDSTTIKPFVTFKKLVIGAIACSLSQQTELFTNNFNQQIFNKIKDNTGNPLNLLDQQQFDTSQLFAEFSSNNYPNSNDQSTSEDQGFHNLNTDLFGNIFNRNFFPKHPDQPESSFPDNPFTFGGSNNPFHVKLSKLSTIKRSIDGTGNNLHYPHFGAKNSPLSRLTQANYEDGKSIPVQSLPNPRDISNIIGDSKGMIENNKQRVTMAFTIWGQFLDHDLDLTEAGKTEPLGIPLKKDDPFYSKNNKQIPFLRSKFLKKNIGGVRQHPNQVTTWIDGSQIYGSDEQTANQLRAFKKGKLKTSNKGAFLPINEGLFLAGDVRVNQNVFLTSFHTIFVREHNRLCDMITYENPKLNDEQVYNIARNYVIGLLQKITFEDFLPRLMGRSAYYEIISLYQGYNPKIDPSIPIQFSTAAFRVGHPLLVSQYPLINFRGIQKRRLELRQLFFNPSLINKRTFHQLLRGLIKTSAKERNENLVEDVRNFLISDSGDRNRKTFLDLFSLNIQRGRDHGLPSYNRMRKAVGLRGYSNFYEMFHNDKQKADQFSKVYGSPRKLDLWLGIISEPKVSGSVLGELGIRIIGDTFRNIRDGDRFWYEKAYPKNIVEKIKGTSLSDIIKRTVPQLQTISYDVFSL